MRIISTATPVDTTRQTAPARVPPAPDNFPVDRAAEENAVRLDEAVNESARHRAIAIEAYYKAQRRGFAPGSELDDWLEAEAEFDQSLEGDTR